MGLPMRKAKVGHTPGPWNHAFSHREHQAEIATADNKIRIGRIDCRTFEECAANARLIAAAPEMLDWLQSLITQPDKLDASFGKGTAKAIADLIAKATGGAK